MTMASTKIATTNRGVRRKAGKGSRTQLPVKPAAASAPAPIDREAAEDALIIDRVERLSRGAGSMLVIAGLIGVIVPGVVGAPILAVGVLAMTPYGRRKLARWQRGRAPKAIHVALRQIDRFMDDLDRRYPPRTPR